MRTLFKIVIRKTIFPFIQELLLEAKKKREEIPIWIMPAGKMPIRSTELAIGFDSFVRAVVSPYEMECEGSPFRKTLFNFKTRPTDEQIARHVVDIEGKLCYRLEPGESTTVGLGFVVAMPFPIFYWMCPRSGFASKLEVSLKNSPGTVDPDYRGEAGAIVDNRSNRPFDIGFQMKIAQDVYDEAIIPTFKVVESYEDLSQTVRGAGGFGSTGWY